MSPLTYQILHVVSVLLLFGLTFSAFANPQPSRKRMLLIGQGIAALVALISAFGLIAKIHANQFQGWMFVKLGVWLVVAALGGIVFRRPQKAGLFAWITAVLGAVAVYMVYARPSF
jgi:uncharacterized membrane protein SirB2